MKANKQITERRIKTLTLKQWMWKYRLRVSMIIAAPFPKGCPQLEHSFFPLTDLQERKTNNLLLWMGLQMMKNCNKEDKSVLLCVSWFFVCFNWGFVYSSVQSKCPLILSGSTSLHITCPPIGLQWINDIYFYCSSIFLGLCVLFRFLSFHDVNQDVWLFSCTLSIITA